jgi:hypothetical protein
MWIYTSTPQYAFMAWCLISWAEGQLTLPKLIIYSKNLLPISTKAAKIRLKDNNDKNKEIKCKSKIVYDLIKSLKNAVFWDVASCTSCVKRRFGGTYHLHLQDRKIRGRRTSVSRLLAEGDTFPRNVGSQIPEDGILHSRRCENLKSCILNNLLRDMFSLTAKLAALPRNPPFSVYPEAPWT